MKTVSNLSELWQQYFVGAYASKGLDKWSITYLKPDGADVFVALADPIHEAYEELFITDSNASELRLFSDHYKQRFQEQLPHRFGLFRPEVDHVLTEYPDWQTFYDAWLADSPALIQNNMPLLFDFPSQEEYRAMRLKDADYAGYRRLLVVLYQYRKRQFQKVFIKNMDDQTIPVVQQQIARAYQLTLPEIMYKEPSNAR